MRHSVKTFALLALLCSTLAVLVPGPALAASAAKKDAVPCWKQVLNDWYDGTINGVYQKQCYVTAIHHLPTEVQIYSSAKDDIQAAEQAMLAGRKAPAEANPIGTTSTTSTTSTSSVGPTTTTTPGGGTAAPGKKSTGIKKFLDQLTPGNPDSFPLPLLILGALAILLIAAGGVGMLWQRSHPRNDPPAAA